MMERKKKFKKNEIAQIAGRAGRNEKDGYFSNTPQTGQLSKQLIDSIEQKFSIQLTFYIGEIKVWNLLL